MPKSIIASDKDLPEIPDRRPWGVRNGFAPMLVHLEAGVYHGGADPRKKSVMLGWQPG